MSQKVAKVVMILVVCAVGYSILGSPGGGFRVNVEQLKQLLLYILLAAAAYAVFDLLRPPRRPPGV
jgi:hypothetical protein